MKAENNFLNDSLLTIIFLTCFMFLLLYFIVMLTLYKHTVSLFCYNA